MLASINIGNVNSDTQIYAVPAQKRTALSVSVVNRAASAVRIRLALVASGATGPAADGSSYIEYDTLVPANTVLERTGLVMLTGQMLFARTDTLGVNVVAYGIEE